MCVNQRLRKNWLDPKLFFKTLQPFGRIIETIRSTPYSEIDRRFISFQSYQIHPIVFEYDF